MSARVLIVDDDEDVRTFLGRTLRRRGYTVEEARDGAEGLASARQSCPDLVITDMAMPRLDGLGLLKALKQAAPDLPVIVLTGHGSLENVLQSMREGALFDYLMKPLPDLALLEVAVLRALEVGRLRARAREADQVTAMRELALTAADRILNPLNVMTLALEGLRRKEPTSDAVARAATKIEQALQRIAAVIHQMSKISRYAPEDLTQNLRLIDLDSAVSPQPSDPESE
jgi:FixJ family two-component response regulator